MTSGPWLEIRIHHSEVLQLQTADLRAQKSGSTVTTGGFGTIVNISSSDSFVPMPLGI